MGNIVSYLKENGDISFIDKVIGPVDALILAQFAYFNFDGIVPEGQAEASVSMSYIRQHADYQNLFSVNWYKDKLREFFELLVASRRFHNMKVNYYVNHIDEEKQIQFSAVTFFLGDGSVVVAFRGTDDALSGWKEDFNMAYMTPVPSQEMSREYMKQIGNLLSRKRKLALYLTGHSKGGNLAVYAAMHCERKLQEKMKCVYNFDGPGFRPEFWKNISNEAIRGKIRKIIPQSSFVGMIMQQDDDYEVVGNNVTGMLQHLPLTWRVVGDDFMYMLQLDEGRKVLNDEINQWILSLNKEELNTFLDAVYYLIDCTKVSTLKELGDNWIGNLIAIGSCYTKNRFEDKNREIFWESANLLLKMLVEDGAEKIRRSGILQSVRDRIENIGIKKETSG